MADELDPVARYGRTLGLTFRHRTVLVEGTSDIDLIQLAARLEHEAGGIKLLNHEFTVIAAGQGDRGGTNGVIRELIALRSYSRTYLSQNGTPHYRFIGLFDNDSAGIAAVKLLRTIDTSILEYKDVFRLLPIMSLPGNLDPGTMQKTFERENDDCKGLKWEMEDLIPDSFMAAFLSEYPDAVRRNDSKGGKVHRELTDDGKPRLHRFIKQNAVRDDLKSVIDLLRALRYYMGLR